MSFLLIVLGIVLGIAVGVVGYPLVVLAIGRREYERASLGADRGWARTVVEPLPSVGAVRRDPEPATSASRP